MINQTVTNSQPQVSPCNLFKYRLKELFIFYFGEKDTEMKKAFAEKQGIHYETVKHHFNIRLTDPDNISSKYLQAYAALLKTEATKLRNRLENFIQ